MSLEHVARERADQFRAEHGLGVAPLGDIAALIEQSMAMDVAILPVADPDIHGFTMRDTVTGVTRIAAACTPHPMRQRSTLLHELAHDLFDDHLPVGHSDWTTRPRLETRADAFARHMLAPLNGVDAWLGAVSSGEVDDGVLSDLVQHFLASPAIVAIQLETAGCISARRKRDWLTMSTSTLALRFGWIEQYTSMQVESQRRRSPQRLLARLTAAYLDGIIGLAPLARVRGTSESSLLAEFHAAGLSPTQLAPKRLDSVSLSTAGDEDMDELDRLLAGA